MTPDQSRTIALESPALDPPAGITPNFVDPENLANNPLAITLLTVSTLVVWARLYTKIVIVKRLVVEDCKCCARDHCKS